MQNIEKGKLLIADPSLLEDGFFKSVILLTHHNYEESIGLVLNKPSNISLFEIINDIPESDFPVYIGGPVAKKSIHFIHNIGSTIVGAKEVMNGLFFGGDFDIVKDLIKNRQITIKEESSNICMQYSDMNLWSKIIKSLDEKYAIWSNMPANPNLN
jgi:putative transcriptional regulator